jgi:RNA polymerase sigma factor (sigma-70 family)
MPGPPSPKQHRTHLDELVRRWQDDQDVDALDELLRHEIGVIKAMVRTRARSLLGTLSATDIAHEAVLGLLRVEEAPSFPNAAALRSYLWTSAWRLLMARLEAKGRRPVRVDLGSTGGFASVFRTTGGLREAEVSDLSSALALVLNLLRPEDREVLDLVHLQGQDLAEAARRIGITREAAKMRLVRARRRLARRLRHWSDLIYEA